MSWDKLNDEKPTPEFRDRVLRNAAAELSKLRGEDVGWMSWRRRLVFAGGLAAIIALVLRPRLRNESSGPGGGEFAQGMDELALEPEMIQNVELLDRLEMLEDLDILVESAGIKEGRSDGGSGTKKGRFG
jgi:hypothetical protein